MNLMASTHFKKCRKPRMKAKMDKLRYHKDRKAAKCNPILSINTTNMYKHINFTTTKISLFSICCKLHLMISDPRCQEVSTVRILMLLSSGHKEV